MDTGRPYSGVHTVWRHPDGSHFELQFHTPASSRIKNEIHGMYEEFRVSTDVVRQRDLYQQMAALWDDEPGPSGWPPIALNTLDGRAMLTFNPPPPLPAL